MKLRRLGEDQFLQQLLPSLAIRPKQVVVGAGDDCAIVRTPGTRDLFVLKTDCVVENIHFETKTAPAGVGWKAMMRPLSDFAAVSALPRFALITLVVPGTKTAKWVRELYRGINRAANRFDVSVVGGETSATRGPAVISVSVAGTVEKDRWVSRAGGKAGDALFVTGRLGGSRRRKHLRFVPRIAESRWLTQRYSVHAMMDLSDGLGSDLPRLARASELNFAIDPALLPVTPGCTVAQAVSDGEDFELLFAVARRDCGSLERSWHKKFPRLPLTRIGFFAPKFEIRNPKLRRGYVHFQKRR
jgi:thiamine-monophosphate kinase